MVILLLGAATTGLRRRAAEPWAASRRARAWCAASLAPGPYTCRQGTGMSSRLLSVPVPVVALETHAQETARDGDCCCTGDRPPRTELGFVFVHAHGNSNEQWRARGPRREGNSLLFQRCNVKSTHRLQALGVINGKKIRLQQDGPLTLDGGPSATPHSSTPVPSCLDPSRLPTHIWSCSALQAASAELPYLRSKQHRRWLCTHPFSVPSSLDGLHVVTPR